MRSGAMLERGEDNSLIALSNLFEMHAKETDRHYANECITPEEYDALNARLGETARTLVEAAAEVPPHTSEGRAAIKRMLAHLDRWDGTSTAERLATSEDLADKLVAALLRGVA